METQNNIVPVHPLVPPSLGAKREEQSPQHQTQFQAKTTEFDAVTWESKEMMLPRPSVEAKEWCSGTTRGDKEIESLSPSGETVAVPCSLMIDRNSLAYSRSTAIRGETPLGSICFRAAQGQERNGHSQGNKFKGILEVYRHFCAQQYSNYKYMRGGLLRTVVLFSAWLTATARHANVYSASHRRPPFQWCHTR